MDRDVLECSLDFAKLADPMKDVLTCEHGRMRFGGIDVAGMAETTPTPFFLFSATQIDRNIATLRDTFYKHHPKTRVFYASKACSNLWFLDRVRRSGIDIEVNSGGELWKARKAGFQPQQIGFNGNAKTRAEIAAALQPPIEAIIVDSVFELRRVADVAADLGVQARVALRVDLNVTSETHPGLRTSKGAKAGIDVSEALAAFGLAAQLPNIELVGMHYHIGSQITRVEPYLEALDLALALLDRVETAHDIRLEHLNIGGGFANPYYLGVVSNHCGKPPVRPFRIGGPLCDGGDVYTGDPGFEYRYLPTCTKVGDIIAFFDVGAYSLECMSAYNGRDQAAAYMVTESGLRQIAARRTVEDFVANERFVEDAAAE